LIYWCPEAQRKEIFNDSLHSLDIKTGTKMYVYQRDW